MKGKKFMDALDVLSGEDSDSDSEGGSKAKGEGEGEEVAPAAKKSKAAIDLETLQRCGYTSGPSVLLMPEPKATGVSNWGWDNGEGHKKDETEEEGAQEREATRVAAAEGVSASMAISRRTWELKEQQHQKRREEHEANKERLFGKKESFNSKEKRKRESGQATRGKNFVEEEKRLGRTLGMYSGFD
mmetsp:Transcript_35709/g.63672  ORF Transcript_35709/g.63672 Transcript_35709/m.63672 type:complete len:187 (-) Transcript_35709:354-914(-)